ncbi:hypothetical protein [Microbacterium luticocti]|uniref:hypothetical protein n=1 Tax=Microbacterium luticocti TaxID=451764 RepID=UPI000416A3F3|nr:hypothetical protein [Microbacterium luticocti]
MTPSDFVARELTQLVRYRSNAEIGAASRAHGDALDPDEIVRLVHEGREDRD